MSIFGPNRQRKLCLKTRIQDEPDLIFIGDAGLHSLAFKNLTWFHVPGTLMCFPSFSLAAIRRRASLAIVETIAAAGTATLDSRRVLSRLMKTAHKTPSTVYHS
jgi:hypothetical protein